MKGIVCALLLLLPSIGATAVEPPHDPAAVLILDRMSAVIGELGSCSYTLETSNDVVDQDHGAMTRLGVHEVCLVGPNKMLVNSRTDKGHRGFWYDGKTVSFYSYDENNYAVVNAPAGILSAIDMVHQEYGIDFAGADFFYPAFADDLIENSMELRYVGKSEVRGKSCFHILARNKSELIQLWIADDALNLPVMYLITKTDQPGAPRYSATFTDWKLNPNLPTSIFEFVPPDSATEITLLPKSGR